MGKDTTRGVAVAIAALQGLAPTVSPRSSAGRRLTPTRDFAPIWREIESEEGAAGLVITRRKTAGGEASNNPHAARPHQRDGWIQQRATRHASATLTRSGSYAPLYRMRHASGRSSSRTLTTWSTSSNTCVREGETTVWHPWGSIADVTEGDRVPTRLNSHREATIEPSRVWTLDRGRIRMDWSSPRRWPGGGARTNTGGGRERPRCARHGSDASAGL